MKTRSHPARRITGLLVLWMALLSAVLVAGGPPSSPVPVRSALPVVAGVPAGPARSASPLPAPTPAPAASGSPAASSTSVRPATPPAAWTLLLYLAADGDLESVMVEDVRAMTGVGSSDRVQVVALLDRSGTGSADGTAETTDEEGDESSSATLPTTLPDWTGARLIRIEKGRVATLQDWGPLDMGDPAVLERFVREATSLFPARRYGLVIADHGVAWQGTCIDASAKGLATLPEIRQALTASRACFGGRLDLIGFDSCLMGNLEVAAEVAPFARTMVASEELAPVDGWRYDNLIRDLQAHPELDGEAVGRLISDGFERSFDSTDDDERGREGLGVTISVMSLDRLPVVTAAVHRLGEELLGWLGKEGGLSALARCRAKCAAFGGESRTDAGYEVFDLKDLAQIVSDRAPTPSVRTAAKAVLAGLDQVVVHNVRGRARADANGLSLFWPRLESGLRTEDGASYEALAFAGSGWWRFIQAFTRARMASIPGLELTDVTATRPDATRSSPAEIASRVTRGEVQEVLFAITDEKAGPGVILGTVPTAADEKGALSESFDGTWYHLRSGKERLLCAISEFEAVEDETETFLATVPAQLRRGEEWVDISISFFLDLGSDRVRGEFVHATHEGRGGPAKLRLRRGDLVRPTALRVAPDGTFKRVPASESAPAVRIRSARELRLESFKVPRGAHRVGFLVEDTVGRSVIKSVTVRTR